MHKSQDIYMHTVKHSCSIKQLQPTTDLQRLSLPWGVNHFTVFTYFTEVRREQLSKTTLSQVALPRTGAEYSHDLFWKQKTFSRFRINCIIRFGCRRGGLGGQRQQLIWQREEKKTSYTFMTPHKDSRKECYITTAKGFNGRVWHQTAH